MPVKPVPDGMHTISPYLRVDGAAELITFLQDVFSGTVTERMMNPDGTVAHAQLKIGDSTLMIGNTGPRWGPFPSSLYLYLPDTDGCYARAIAAGATSLREPIDEFYGDRNAAVRDRWGNEWWMATHIEDVSHEEMERRLHDLQASGNR